MKRVLIVEDKKEAREALEQLVCGLQEDIRVFPAGDCGSAYRCAMEHDISLFLVDIILNPGTAGDVSGIRFAENIRQIPGYRFTPLIFITSLEDPELYAYRDLHCYGYISKPYPPEPTAALIRKALSFPEEKRADRIVYFKKDGVLYSRKQGEIVYIRTRLGKMSIRTVRDELDIYYKTCDQILRELDSDAFVKCSRNTIVNRNYIANIDSANQYIELVDGYGRLEIGSVLKRRFLKEVFHD